MKKSPAQENTWIKAGCHALLAIPIFGRVSPFDESIAQEPTSFLPLLNSWCFAFCPRNYPAGFGVNLRLAWEAHMAACNRRELRFKPQPLSHLTPLEQFQNLAMGDKWEEAKLWEPMAYILKSKRLRCGIVETNIPK